MRDITCIGLTLRWLAVGLLALPLLAADVRLTVAGQADAYARNQGVTVEKIRVGRHKTKTRIVLDLSGPVDFDYRISDHGRTMVVLLPKVTWKARGYFTFGAKSPLYRIRFFPNAEGGGGILSILARKRIGLSMVELLPPERDYSHRLVLDIPKNIRRARKPPSGVVRNGRIYPPHEQLPPYLQAKRKTRPQTAKRRR